MKKKEVANFKLALVANPDAKTRAENAKSHAAIRKWLARKENRPLILELAMCFARAAVHEMIEGQKKKPARRLKAKRQRR